MSRRIVIAIDSFASGDLEALVGKHHEVISPGVIRQGTRLWADDAIVLSHPTLFVSAHVVPGAVGAETLAGDDLWSRAEWRAIVEVYRSRGKPRPSQLEVAEEMGLNTEQPLRDRLRALGIVDWRAVHALVKGQPQ